MAQMTGLTDTPTPDLYLWRIWGCPHAPDHRHHVGLTVRAHVGTRGNHWSDDLLLNSPKLEQEEEVQQQPEEQQDSSLWWGGSGGGQCGGCGGGSGACWGLRHGGCHGGVQGCPGGGDDGAYRYPRAHLGRALCGGQLALGPAAEGGDRQDLHLSHDEPELPQLPIYLEPGQRSCTSLTMSR